MYLHEDRELFREVVMNTAARMNLSIAVVELKSHSCVIEKVQKNSTCVGGEAENGKSGNVGLFGYNRKID